VERAAANSLTRHGFTTVQRRRVSPYVRRSFSYVREAVLDVMARRAKRLCSGFPFAGREVLTFGDFFDLD
jgi:hypothetical protein